MQTFKIGKPNKSIECVKCVANERHKCLSQSALYNLINTTHQTDFNIIRAPVADTSVHLSCWRHCVNCHPISRRHKCARSSIIRLPNTSSFDTSSPPIPNYKRTGTLSTIDIKCLDLSSNRISSGNIIANKCGTCKSTRAGLNLAIAPDHLVDIIRQIEWRRLWEGCRK